MKKINKLMTATLVLLVAFSIQSCEEKQFYPGNLVGTWSMTTQEMIGNSETIYEDDITIDDEIIKTESIYDLTYQSDGMHGTSTSTRTYDATGTVKSEVSKRTYEGGTVYREQTITLTDNSATIFKDTTVAVNNISYEVVFNKDKTFTITTLNNSESEFESSDSYEKSVYTVSTNNKDVQTGSWAFIGKDKNQDFKNNERIGMWLSKINTTNSSTYTATYTDLDTGDSYPASDNTKTVSEDVSSNVIDNTEPDMVWEMVEGSKKEMKITYIDNSHTTGTATTAYTVGNTTTTTTANSDTQDNMSVIANFVKQ